ncbi:hypothetical protein K438DRAFT_1996994 [Mycena galopus ATCC 62051]|nr:hypothetical protein K438DRAFT_1996994 [Mycena galopus ATCC 62051]
MPPKGQRKALDPVFRQHEKDPEKIQCIVCAEGISEERRVWISVRSATTHLQAPSHSKAVTLFELRNQEREERTRKLEREREAEAATDELRDIQFAAAPHFNGPAASTSFHVMSEAEAKLWEDYRVNGAEFDAGEDIEDLDTRNWRRLRDEAEIFGLWNPEATARKLGFGDEGVQEKVEEDEDEDFLEEILRNVGEFYHSSVSSGFEPARMVVLFASEFAGNGQGLGSVETSILLRLSVGQTRDSRKDGWDWEASRDGSFTITCTL